MASTSDPILDARGFWELLDRRAEATPGALMLVDADDRRVTFAEFRSWAERVAAGLYALGVREGTNVTWVLPTRIETMVVSLALSRLGAVQNPIIQIYRDREIGFCIRQTAAQFVLVPGTWNDFDYTAMVERVTADLANPPTIVTAYDTLPEGDPAILPPPPSPTAHRTNAPIRWIYYTSGTTSDPKGVQHTDQTLIAAGIGLAHALALSTSDVASIAFPYAHIGGPDFMVCLLANGFSAVTLERFVPTEAVEIYARHGVTMAGGSTAFYLMFLNEQRKQPGQPIIPTLRILSGGGAPKPPEVFYDVKAEMGIPVAHGYGMTECPMIAQGSPTDPDEMLATTEGAPVLGCEITIVRDDGTVAEPGHEGEVRVVGPMLFKGYTDPALNVDAFDEHGRFRTGDLGVVHANGHITLTGRVKDIIIRKGENISAKEIEDVLYAHPKLEAAAVIGLPDRERGERVCAVVQTALGQEPITFDEMVAACRSAGLMVQKIPEQLEVVDALPRNATLKILKYQLRDDLTTKPHPT